MNYINIYKEFIKIQQTKMKFCDRNNESNNPMWLFCLFCSWYTPTNMKRKRYRLPKFESIFRPSTFTSWYDLRSARCSKSLQTGNDLCCSQNSQSFQSCFVYNFLYSSSWMYISTFFFFFQEHWICLKLRVTVLVGNKASN